MGSVEYSTARLLLLVPLISGVFDGLIDTMNNNKRETMGGRNVRRSGNDCVSAYIRKHQLYGDQVTTA